MKILIDTREQLPLEFNHPYINEIVRIKLEVGDYGAEFSDGHKPNVFFECKSISDLFLSLSGNYDRFKKEIIRAKEHKLLLIIIIEGTLTKVIKGIDESQRSGDEITQQLFTLFIRYQIPFVCCQSRQEMSRYITEFYLAIGREYIRKK